MSDERSPQPALPFPSGVVDFPTLAPEAWLSQGHEALTVREAARRIGVSESTLRRVLRVRTPGHGAATTLAETRGVRFAAQRTAAPHGRRWTVYVLGPAAGAGHAGPAPVAELRARVVADAAGLAASRHWWRFGR